MPEDGVEQDQMGHPLGVGDGEGNGIGPGRIVTDQHRTGDVQPVETATSSDPCSSRENPAVSERPDRPYPSQSKVTARLGVSSGKSLS